MLASGVFAFSSIAAEAASVYWGQMRSLEDIRQRLREVNQSAVGREIGLTADKVNNIAHGRRDLTYAEGVALLPILFPEEESVSAATDRVRHAESRRCVDLAADLVEAFAEKLAIEEAKANLLRDLLSASLRAALFHDPAAPGLPMAQIAELIWNSRPPQ